MVASSIYHGHLVLASTFLLNVCAIGAFTSAGLYLGPLAAAFPASSGGALALTCTVQIVAALASSLAGGIAQEALERSGVGLQWLFFGGGSLMMAGYFVSSFSSALLGVMFGSLLIGIGFGLGGLMSAGICVLWFESARGTMLLLAMSGQGLGNAFFAWATAKLLEHYYPHDEQPWRPTMRWMGILCFVLCAVASVSMRLPNAGEVEGYEKRSDTVDTTGSVRYGSVDDATGLQLDMRLDMRQRRRRSSAGHALEQMRKDTGHTRQSILNHDRRRRSTMLGSFQAVANTPLLKLSDFGSAEVQGLRALFSEVISEDGNEYTLWELILTKTNVWLCAFTLIVCFPFLNMQVLLPPYIESLGMPPSMGGHALALYGIAVLSANLTLGPVADKVGARPLFAFAFLVLSLLFFLWPNCTTGTSLSVIAFLYGYFCAMQSSMPIIILADAYGESSSEHILALNGLMNMFKFPGYLLGSPIASQIAAGPGGYRLAAYCSGLVMLVGTMMLLVIPAPEEQQRQLLLISSERSKLNQKGGFPEVV